MSDTNDELRELYQQIIIDHSKRPHNFGPLEGATRHAEGFNPLCGDHFTVHLKLEGDRIAEARFEGAGCAISTASASVMTDVVRGKTLAEAAKLFEGFHAVVTSDPTSDVPEEVAGQPIGKLAAFAGVREFAARVKCATLPWHALASALSNTKKGDPAVAKTE